MTEEKNDNPELLTLDQLKSGADGGGSEEPSDSEEAVEAKAVAPSERRSRSFIDDAESLLADIRSSVEDDVTSERARYDSERREAELERERRAEESRQAARAEIESKLEVERARRQAAAEEREAREQAMDLEDRRARGEVIDEPAEPKQAVETPRPVVESAAVPTEERRGTGFYLAIVGIPVLAIVGIGAFLIMNPGEPLNEPSPGLSSPKVTVVAPPVAPPVLPTVAADAAATKKALAASDAGVGDGGTTEETVGSKPEAAKRKKRKKRLRRGSKGKGRKARKKKRKKTKKKKKKSSKKGTLSFDEDDGF